jgi:transposase
MWPDLSQVRVMIRPGSTDMRKQINGLSAMVQNAMTETPFSGDLYLFCGRDKTLIKAIYWDRNGFCLWTKRLEKGRFPWPDGEAAARQLSREELGMLLDGIDFRKKFEKISYRSVG